MNSNCIVVNCPECGRKYRVNAFDQQKNYLCHHCHQLIPVNPISYILNIAGDTLYRELIQQVFNQHSATHLRNVVIEQETNLAHHFGEELEEDIYQIVDHFTNNKKFWKNATCRTAFEKIIQLYIDILPCDFQMSTPGDALRHENQHLAYQLFHIANLYFAYNASLNRKHQKCMGIQQNYFN